MYVKTIVQITLEVEHFDTSDPADVAARVTRVVHEAINWRGGVEALLSDVLMYRTRVLSSSHAAVPDLVAEAARLAAMSDEEKHRACCHPDWEYEQTETSRKTGETKEPEGEGWIRNNRVACHVYDAGVVVEERWRHWERFEFHEVEYWRRPRTHAEEPPR
jgi:hypothetical protein